MKKIKLGAVALVALAGGICSTWAQAVPGYLTDSRGAAVKSQFNLCYRTGSWTPALATAECEPDLVATPKPKPEAIKPEASKPVLPPMVPGKPAPAKPEAAKPAPRAAAEPKTCDVTVALSSDELFAFGKAVLTKAAKVRLDKDVIARLPSCARLDSIVVEGYTDRLGSRQVNQKLSVQRAEAVKAYLLSKRVPAKIVSTVGKADAAPAKICTESGSRKQLIACLAPNRRVVVGIKGLGK